MNLSSDLKKIINDVEELSGVPVIIKHEPTLQTLSTVRTAKQGDVCHTVLYRQLGSTTNYIIAFQLGFLVRQFSLDRDSRWELASSDDERKSAIDVLALSEFPANLAASLVDSLLIQLRSCAIGLKIDEWIFSEYPDLLNAQTDSTLGQLSENLGCLAPEVKDNFPADLINANITMNAAYAKFWSDKLDDPRHFLPYLSLGYSESAQKLLDVILDAPDAPSGDRKLVESWGEILGLSQTYHIQKLS